MPLFFSFFGCLLSFVIYRFSFFTLILVDRFSSLNWLYSFFNRKWYFDNVYNDFLMNSVVKSGYSVFVKSIDKGLLEFLGPLGLSFFFKDLSLKISNFQTGLVYHYAFMLLVGLLSLLTLFAFNMS